MDGEFESRVFDELDGFPPLLHGFSAFVEFQYVVVQALNSDLDFGASQCAKAAEFFFCDVIRAGFEAQRDGAVFGGFVVFLSIV